VQVLLDRWVGLAAPVQVVVERTRFVGALSGRRVRLRVPVRIRPVPVGRVRLVGMLLGRSVDPVGFEEAVSGRPAGQV
jgi:hypothetical protein